MNIQLIAAIFTTIYLMIALLLAMFFNNNLMFWRSRRYEIPYGRGDGWQVRKEVQNPRVVYWVCENPRQENPDDWVVLLHSFGRNSGRMVPRAKTYWEMGFSLIFIDARSHGQSQRTLISQGFTYAEDVERVLEVEKLTSPIIHGLSVGAIAGAIYAHRHPVRAYVGEALLNNYYDMVIDTYTMVGLPRFTYRWVADLLMKLNLPFEEYRPGRILPLIDAPIYLIHGENDRWFTVEKHFRKNLEGIKDRDDVWTWVVPGSPHSKMARHPEYHNRLRQFVESIKILYLNRV